MTKRRLYLLLGISCAVGYSWFFVVRHLLATQRSLTVCLFKQVSGVPCPSCGSSRAAVLVSGGDFARALAVNPLGFVVAGALAVIPVWLIADWITRGDSLYRAYVKFEQTVRIKWLATLLIVLLLANWIWNITKQL